MILVIDNYDSFTYNLVQYIKTFQKEVLVKRNDQITIDDIKKLKPGYIVLSPGPGNPDTAGICLEVVHEFHQEIPILGVCLGHQIIAQYFGAKIVKAIRPMHGKVEEIDHDRKGIFNRIPTPFTVTRYHSLIVDRETLPDCIEISARAKENEIMALRHKKYKVEGVQFHPESIMTDHGMQLLKNFFTRGVE